MLFSYFALNFLHVAHYDIHLYCNINFNCITTRGIQYSLSYSKLPAFLYNMWPLLYYYYYYFILFYNLRHSIHLIILSIPSRNSSFFLPPSSICVPEDWLPLLPVAICKTSEGRERKRKREKIRKLIAWEMHEVGEGERSDNKRNIDKCDMWGAYESIDLRMKGSTCDIRRESGEKNTRAGRYNATYERRVPGS